MKIIKVVKKSDVKADPAERAEVLQELMDFVKKGFIDSSDYVYLKSRNTNLCKKSLAFLKGAEPLATEIVKKGYAPKWTVRELVKYARNLDMLEEILQKKSLEGTRLLKWSGTLGFKK